jgi:uracil-DNA glycosylase
MGKDWFDAFKSEFDKPYFKTLKSKLADEVVKHTIYPPLEDVYSFTRYSTFRNVKVVILGQDPYHGPGQAHGLAFSVRKGVAIPPSLQNMYKELARSTDFKIPRHGCLEGWSKQGVLLLNASLTVRAGQASTHSQIGWQQFTDSIIKYIASNNQCVFMLWGAHAQKKASFIPKGKHLILKTVHPSPLSAYRGFIGCDHFKLCNEWLKNQGKEEIDWSCI